MKQQTKNMGKIQNLISTWSSSRVTRLSGMWSRLGEKFKILFSSRYQSRLRDRERDEKNLGLGRALVIKFRNSYAYATLAKTMKKFILDNCY